MVVKPLEYVAKGRKGLVQPAVKVRGREYLRIIYGAEYTLPENLQRLKVRGLGAKRSLALREFALGLEALERFVRIPVFAKDRLLPLAKNLISLVHKLEGCGAVFRGSLTQRLCNTVAFTVRGCDSIALLAGLDLEGICASSGSACSAGSLEPSHVLSAMDVEKEAANALIRFSLGRDSSLAEVQRVEEVLPEIIGRVQRFPIARQRQRALLPK